MSRQHDKAIKVKKGGKQESKKKIQMREKCKEDNQWMIANGCGNVSFQSIYYKALINVVLMDF